MSNCIWENKNSCKGLSLSNGATAVLLTIIGLSGTRLAKSADEKCLIVWLMEKDQSAVGIGTIGFFLGELPWEKALFGVQKQFFEMVLDGAYQKFGWETLPYQPNEEILFPALDQLKSMLQELKETDILQGEKARWLSDAAPDDPVLCGFPVCEKHLILRSCYGCYACNDGW